MLSIYHYSIITIFLNGGCTYNRLVTGKFLSQVEHQQHEPNETKQMSAHLSPRHRGGRRIHTVSDVHVKIPVNLKHKNKRNKISLPSLIISNCYEWLSIKVTDQKQQQPEFLAVKVISFLLALPSSSSGQGGPNDTRGLSHAETYLVV